MTKRIKDIIDRENEAWNTKNVDLLLSIFHNDMVWPWPKNNISHNPANWELKLGKFNYNRWKKIYFKFFNEHRLIHNNRIVVKIKMSNELDAAIAIIDIDTLWENIITKLKNHWYGRVSKVYVKVGNQWKLIMHTGPLVY
ncbi:hypothetical protein COW80_02515 [Candidatus Beckwithbacteria bacterium CG22_combo_CG10-13_8_21_14_all_01_47_9]|uniref:SnoaL-like domain-containing protein n=3 Tax=Candidatus Beckwithiibacteriota TaxID=1752726 RepID=A0A2H0E0V5_9BACT|nr:MAG: hypothetical protein AUJ59_00760 [Candidatus Beckwithbacteria bacterium CG1_02_47_37]PIP88055.1 MAG: hypothetical protein COW80_02515 [Candidatus Beckwithbacteria bacterium CG22_combo_CG10-13_8_21_14_all_01_47_9]PJC66734.1 MAG: hypothetical protein CO018_00335 [Candidatus Beckwithbacteria bacterium CG_4_9_14_0_2_um_filter_47_11]